MVIIERTVIFYLYPIACPLGLYDDRDGNFHGVKVEVKILFMCFHLNLLTTYLNISIADASLIDEKNLRAGSCLLYQFSIRENGAVLRIHILLLHGVDMLFNCHKAFLDRVIHASASDYR